MNDETLIHTIKNRIEKARKEAKLTQYAVEKAISAVRPNLYRWETQRQNPTMRNLAKLCVLLKKKPEELIFFDFTPVYKIMDEIKRPKHFHNSLPNTKKL